MVADERVLINGDKGCTEAEAATNAALGGANEAQDIRHYVLFFLL